MYVVIISWPEDSERGVEPYGPFDDEPQASEWVDKCQDAADRGWLLLKGANYLMTPLDIFDPDDLMQDGARNVPAPQKQ